MIATFVAGDEPLVLGLDDHMERRRGEQIAAKGIYRAQRAPAVRSSKSFFVKTSGLRWVSMMVLTTIPWIGRVWALPFLTVLAPSERYHEERGVQHQKLTDWARQLIRQVRRWLPDRMLVVVADSSYAVLELLATWINLRQPLTMVTRLRLDAALYDPAPHGNPASAVRRARKEPDNPRWRSAAPTPVRSGRVSLWAGMPTRSAQLNWPRVLPSGITLGCPLGPCAGC